MICLFPKRNLKWRLKIKTEKLCVAAFQYYYAFGAFDMWSSHSHLILSQLFIDFFMQVVSIYLCFFLFK